MLNNCYHELMNTLYNRYYELTNKALSYQSISTDTVYKPQIKECAMWYKSLLESMNMTVEVIEGYGNPLVYASYIHNNTLPTCLIYGHYDIQPADISDGWKANPYSIYEENGKLYGRGVVDNKGQTMIHIAVLEELIRTHALQYNIKLLLEGDEESGSGALDRFLEDYKDTLKADFMMVSDGELALDYPCLELGFRGSMNCTLSIRTLSDDLHSGAYGNAAPNAAQVLAYLLSTLYNKEQKEVLVDGFYDDIVDDILIDSASKTPFDEAHFKEYSGSKVLLDSRFYYSVGLKPTLQISTLQSGYMGTGYRNGIPAVATAKINIRAIPSADPKTLYNKLSTHLQKHCPDYATMTLAGTDSASGCLLDASDTYSMRAKDALETAYNKPIAYKYCGGTLPIATDIQRLYGIPQLYIPLANEDCGMHAANENFDIELIHKGLDFSKRFFSGI